jgi:hypothetical protein
MPTSALLCSMSPLDSELQGTVLWGRDVERRVARDVAEALMIAQESPLNLVVVDRSLPAAAPLVAALRGSPRTRGASIVVLARGDFAPVDAELVASGANAVLRFPPDREWDQRLLRLMKVPPRRDVQVSVSVTTEDGALKMKGTGLNLSANGMLLEIDDALLEIDNAVGLDAVLDLSFRLPGFEPVIVARGRVMRLAGPGRFGVEFLSLDDDGADVIRCFVGVTAGRPAGS